MTSEQQTKKQKRNQAIKWLAAFFIIAGILTFLYWFIFMRPYATTDDAYIDGNMLSINPQTSGTIIAYYVDETDLVDAGQVVAILDETDAQLAFASSKSNLELTVRQVKELWERKRQGEALITIRKAELAKAIRDYESRHDLLPTNSIAKEDVEHAETTTVTSQASLDVAQYQLQEILAAIGEGELKNHPSIAEARVRVQEAFLRLKRCAIKSPTRGYVARRNAQLGEWASTNKIVMSIVPLDQIWVNANFKETELADIRIGQPATIYSDIYGSAITYQGSVVGIGMGTGSVFSLIPPQNATGNWIKIVQRIPVRISLDADQIKKFPLRLGLSTYVKVSVTDRSGPMLAQMTSLTPLDSTDIYQIPMQELDEMMNQMIENILQTGS